MTRRAVVVLPDPDSPTSACVVPRRTRNDTSSTARNGSRPPHRELLDEPRRDDRVRVLGRGGSGIRRNSGAGAGAKPSAASAGRVGEQLLRVRRPAGAPGCRRGRALLHDPAVLEHDDPLRAVGGDAEVVGDEEHRGALLAAQVVDQVEDPPLHGDVEGAGRLVGDDQRAAAGRWRWR